MRAKKTAPDIQTLINHMKGRDETYWLGFAGAILAFLVSIYTVITNEGILSTQASVFVVIFSLLTVLFSGLMRRHFLIYYLLSLFCLLVAWRIIALEDIWPLMVIFFVVFVAKACDFFFIAYCNLKGIDGSKIQLSMADWQLIFIRLYIGLDLVAHFTEKLFAGVSPRMEDYHAFVGLGVHDTMTMVILAGLCELAGCIGVGLGLFTRLAALGTGLYILIATIMGHHFLLGFIWATPSGGYEYPLMWMVLIVSFAFYGGGAFSLDAVIKGSGKPAGWIKKLMG